LLYISNGSNSMNSTLISALPALIESGLGKLLSPWAELMLSATRVF
jgi:hypothetical protein